MAGDRLNSLMAFIRRPPAVPNDFISTLDFLRCSQQPFGSAFGHGASYLSSPGISFLGAEACSCLQRSGFCAYSPPYLDRIWGIWGSCYNIPQAVFYLLKGNVRFLTQLTIRVNPLEPIRHETATKERSPKGPDTPLPSNMTCGP